MSAILLALLGMGVLGSAFILTQSEDDEEHAADSPEDEEAADARDLLHLNALDTVTGTQAGEVFVAETARGDAGHVNIIDGFDPQADLVGFDLDQLARQSFEDSAASFSSDASLEYRLDVTPSDQTDSAQGAMITLSLFDSADPGGDEVHFDVLLRGIDDVSEDCVSIVTGEAQLSQAQGGERASTIEGTEAADNLTIDDASEMVSAGDGDDTISGAGDGVLILGGTGNDSISVTGTGHDVYGGSGDDDIDVGAGPSGAAVDAGIYGGAGDDTITTELGGHVEGGAGTDHLTFRVTEAPSDGLPLELWRQPVEDARFEGHSTVSLDDDNDTVRLEIDPSVSGHLHQVRLLEETYGLNDQEIYTHEYTLIIWTPEGVSDIADLVTGSGAVYNSSFAQDHAIGSDEYEAAVNDANAPRILLTINHGESFSGSFDEISGTTSGEYDDSREVNLVLNREVTSVHSGQLH